MNAKRKTRNSKLETRNSYVLTVDGTVDTIVNICDGKDACPPEALSITPRLIRTR